MSEHKVPLMPALFVGHGNPMLSISDNQYTRSWAELGKSLPRPRAILAISAHWYVSETQVTAMPLPRTIHDFYGFPDELFQVDYPAAGSSELAQQVADLLLPNEIKLDQQWGLDHGTWSVLRHMYPQAQIPVVQLSLDLSKSPEEHFRLGQKLKALRREGVLILASGNIVHNIQGFNWRQPDITPPGWASEFEGWVRDRILSGRAEQLIDYQSTGKMAMLAAPTPDHYLPLLYLAALGRQEDRTSFPVEGFDGGTMSMLTVLVEDSQEHLAEVTP